MKHAKKILFICDRNFAYLMSKLWFYFTDKWFDCSASIVTWKIYYDKLRSGTIESPFTNIYLTQDASDHPNPETFFDPKKARHFEKKYWIPTLWLYARADRGFVYDQYRKNVWRMIRLFEFFEEIYSKEKPKYVITNAYASMTHLISYMVATKMWITVIKPTPTRLSKKMFFSTTLYDNIVPVHDIPKKLYHEVEEFVDRFRETAKQREYYIVDTAKTNAQSGINEKIRYNLIWFGCRYAWRYYISKAYQGDHTKPPPHVMIRREVQVKRRKFYTKKMIHFDTIPTWQKYVYFPLQLQPEMTTMTLAPFYVNQISTLEALSKSVSADTIIAVKEHPHVIWYRWLNYYKEIQKFSNVIFIDPSIDTLELARWAEFVFSLTGTACLEAMVLWKPSVMCGMSYFSDHPLICNLYNTALPKRHDRIYSYLNDYKYDKDKVVSFIAHAFGNAFPIKMVEPWDHKWSLILEKENVQWISKALELVIEKLENMRSKK